MQKDKTLLLIFSFFLQLLVFSHGSINKLRHEQHDVKDFCLVGAGAGGLGLAAMLKDAGYSVVVLEQSSVIGGQCNTFSYLLPNGTSSWMDSGVIVYYNTTFANEKGYGPWLVDVPEFIKRFAGQDAIIPVLFNGATFWYADFNKSIDYGPQVPPTSLDFAVAFEKLQTLMNTTYRWMDTDNWPDQLPTALLQGFKGFSASEGFDPLYYLFNLTVFGSGWGSYDKLTAIYGIQPFAPTTALGFTAPEAVFSVKNGCYQIYKGIAEYLGQENIRTDVKIHDTWRPSTSSNLPVFLYGREGAIPHSHIFTQGCGKLIIGFPPTLENLQPYGLDPLEMDLFSQVRTRQYTTTAANFSSCEGTLGDLSGGFYLINVNGDNFEYNPTLPTVLSMIRPGEREVGVINAYADPPLSKQRLQQLMIDETSTVPQNLLTRTCMKPVGPLNVHAFAPYFTLDALNQTPNPYTRLHNLQGHRNTYYVGALSVSASSTAIWNDACRLMQTHFLPDNQRGKPTPLCPYI